MSHRNISETVLQLAREAGRQSVAPGVPLVSFATISSSSPAKTVFLNTKFLVLDTNFLGFSKTFIILYSQQTQGPSRPLDPPRDRVPEEFTTLNQFIIFDTKFIILNTNSIILNAKIIILNTKITI